jgi:hypothetical protein
MSHIRTELLLATALGLGLLHSCGGNKQTTEGSQTGGSVATGGRGLGGITGGQSGGGQGGTNGNTGGTYATSGASATGGTLATGGSSGIGGTSVGGSSSSCTSFAGIGTTQCVVTSVQSGLSGSNVLLVIDTSGSMTTVAGTATQSKWTILTQALSQTLTKTDVDPYINFGLELFPYGAVANGTTPAEVCPVPTGADAIQVPITDGSTTDADDVLGVLTATSPTGGTPMAQALQQAYTYFATGNGKSLVGTRWILLATDGGPNCNSGLTCNADTCTQNMDGNCGGASSGQNCCAGYGYICLDYEAVSNAIAQLANIQVKTFVVGIPGSEAYAAYLDEFADAGGMPNSALPNGHRYYPVSESNTLNDMLSVFSTITAQLVTSCDIELEQTPPDPTSVNVAVDCRVISASIDGGAVGWTIDYATSPAHLTLLGSTCDSFTQQGSHSLDVIIGCPTAQ